MIHQNVIKRRADEDRMPASAVERDYVLALVLTAISARDEGRQLVFKGGTSLRLCHFDDYRYSADLDFSLTGGGGTRAATELIAEALVDCREKTGLPMLELDERNPPRIGYVGPLGARPRFVKLDLAADELVVDTTILPIRCRYGDQEDGRCRVYTLEEIAAEKLRCVMQRLQCRDLYDLHELLVMNEVDAETAWPSFERKARHRDRDPDLFGESFEDRVPRWQARWDRELIEYTASPPEFGGALRSVRRALRFALR